MWIFYFGLKTRQNYKSCLKNGQNQQILLSSLTFHFKKSTCDIDLFSWTIDMEMPSYGFRQHYRLCNIEREIFAFGSYNSTQHNKCSTNVFQIIMYRSIYRSTAIFEILFSTQFNDFLQGLGPYTVKNTQYFD